MSVIDEHVLTQSSFKQSTFPGVTTLKPLNGSFLLFQFTVISNTQNKSFKNKWKKSIFFFFVHTTLFLSYMYGKESKNFEDILVNLKNEVVNTPIL